jgi:hypothetical protein
MHMEGLGHAKHRGNYHEKVRKFTYQQSGNRENMLFTRELEYNMDTIVDHPSKLTYKETQLFRIHSRKKFMTRSFI